MLSDIVVMPSIDPEPFGRIIIEAQALNKIAIGFDHGGISESIIDNETGLLAKPLDVNDLGKKIETALQFNKTQRKIINNNAKKNKLSNCAITPRRRYNCLISFILKIFLLSSSNCELTSINRLLISVRNIPR